MVSILNYTDSKSVGVDVNSIISENFNKTLVTWDFNTIDKNTHIRQAQNG